MSMLACRCMYPRRGASRNMSSSTWGTSTFGPRAVCGNACDWDWARFFMPSEMQWDIVRHPATSSWWVYKFVGQSWQSNVKTIWPKHRNWHILIIFDWFVGKIYRKPRIFARKNHDYPLTRRDVANCRPPPWAQSGVCFNWCIWLTN